MDGWMAETFRNLKHRQATHVGVDVICGYGGGREGGRRGRRPRPEAHTHMHAWWASHAQRRSSTIAQSSKHGARAYDLLVGANEAGMPGLPTRQDSYLIRGLGSASL